MHIDQTGLFRDRPQAEESHNEIFLGVNSIMLNMLSCSLSIYQLDISSEGKYL